MSFLSSAESWIIDKSNMHANLYLWFSLLSSLGGGRKLNSNVERDQSC